MPEEVVIDDTGRQLRLFQFMVVAAGLAVLAIRLPLAASESLWLDETWTAMIAGQETWSAFWKEAWLDVNPPLYYAFMKVWIAVFGDSNLALRLPSILFIVAAASSAVLLRPRWMPPASAWLWAALVLLWSPGSVFMLDARAYALLILLATLSALVFLRLCSNLERRHVYLWVAIGTLMFLTHYYTAVLLSAQAMVLLAIHRERLVAHWPAAFIALPGLAWLFFHYGRLAEYSQPEVVWYDGVSWSKAFSYFLFVAGISFYHFIVLIALVAAFAFFTRYKGRSGAFRTVDFPVLAGVSVGALAFLLAFLIGFFQPSLASRYLTPLVPFAALGLVYLAQISRRGILVAFLFVAILIVPSLMADRVERLISTRTIYGFENVSDFAAQAQPDQLVFAWDHPAAKILDPNSLEKLGSFFVRRAGLEVETIIVRADRTQDLNNLIADSAAPFENPAIIWIYNTTDRSAAHLNPPRFEDDPAWNCLHEYRDAKEIRSGSIGCIRTRSGGEL